MSESLTGNFATTGYSSMKTNYLWGHSGFTYKDTSQYYLDMEGKIMNATNWAVTIGTSVYTINSPQIVNLTAAGLRHSDIEIKEIDGNLSVKVKSEGLKGYYSNLNNQYTLKNVKLLSSKLSLGVLTLEFVDSENVVRHKIVEE